MELNKERITEILLDNYGYLASEYGVKRIGLFRSYAKETSIQPTSDVDIVVEFDRPIGFKFMELADFLEGILGKPVDLLTENTIQNIRYPHIAQSIRESIIYVQ